ncbi:MAG TPA: cupin domain-containing protein [Steroidobacteraceae bacterium]|nr:cupin domain-containing protein [Steroidobacteraceae bacterium]
MSEPKSDPGSADQAKNLGVSRRILERIPIPGDHRELVVAEVTYPPAEGAPMHRHPVAGIVYVVEGIAESAYGQDEPRQYLKGETLQDRADLIHTHFRNCDAHAPLRFLTIYVLEPGRSYITDP